MLQMASRDAVWIPEATIRFENLNFVLNGDEERVGAPKARPLPPMSLDATMRARSGPCVVLTPETIARFGSLEFIFNDEGGALRAPPTCPSPPKNPDTIAEALGGLILTPPGQRAGQRSSLPY